MYFLNISLKTYSKITNCPRSFSMNFNTVEFYSTFGIWNLTKIELVRVFEYLKWLPVIIIRIELTWWGNKTLISSAPISLYKRYHFPQFVAVGWNLSYICQRRTVFPFHSSVISVLSIQHFAPVDITILTMVRLHCATLLLRAQKKNGHRK